MSASERFTKAYDQLIGLGLSPRLVLLYGKLGFHAGNDGKCYPRHSTLARELGLNDPKWIARLLARLSELKLVEWTRYSRYPNEYRGLQPDLKWISQLMDRRRPIRNKVAEGPPNKGGRGATHKRVIIKRTF